MRGIIYFHVPKCGGSSFGAALRLRFFYSQATIDLAKSGAAVAALYPDTTGEERIEAEYQFRRDELARHMARGVRCIAGHVRYDPALHSAAAHDYVHVTMLRDPVERFVSHFRYLCRRHPQPDRPATLDQFLETPDAARIASQYLFYFGGSSQTRSADVGRTIRRARAALARFDLVGDLSDPTGFARDLRRLTGGPLPWLHRNRAPAKTIVPAEFHAKIAALCAADIEIYRTVQSLRAA